MIKGVNTNYFTHKLLHAIAGCGAGAAAGGACRDGAIGSAVGEVVAELMPPANDIMYSDAEKIKVLAYSKLVAGAVAAYSGGDAQTAITTAETAVENNNLRRVKGVAKLADEVARAYEISQDIIAVKNGSKTLEELALQKGENYVTGAIVGGLAKGGINAVKVGGKWIQTKGNKTPEVDSRASYTPNAGSVGNMKTFLESPGFGSELGNSSRKTSQRFQGEAIYEIEKDLNANVKKGYLVYLDKTHKNHLEVFNSKGEGIRAVNLDGSENAKKTPQVQKRRIIIK